MRIIDLNSQAESGLPGHRRFMDSEPIARTQVVCAHPSTAEYLGVPYCSLEMLARQQCQQQGWSLLSPLMAHQRRITVLRELLSQGELSQGELSQGETHHSRATSPTAMDIRAIERRLRPGLTTLLRSGSDIEALEQVTAATSPLMRLLRLTRAYGDRLEQEMLVDPAQVYQRAAWLQPTPRPLWLFGYSEWIDRQPRLLFWNAMAGAGSVLALPESSGSTLEGNQRAIAQLQALGWQIETGREANARLPNSAPTSPQRVRDSQATAYPNQEEEVRGVLRQVKRLLDQGVAPQAMALITWSEQSYHPTILDLAWEYKLPIASGGSGSLLTTPLGSWLKQAFETVRSRFEFESTAALLRHPLTPCEPTLRGEIDWDKVRRYHPHNLRRWQDCGALLTPLEQWTACDRSTWMARLQQLLQHWQLESRCQSHPDDCRAWSAWETAQQYLAQLPDTPKTRLTLTQWTQELLESLSLVQVAASCPEGAIALQSPQAMMGATYRHLWILGVADGILPSPLNCDPPLDLYSRKQLQKQGFAIETALTLSQRQRLLFKNLLGSTGQVHLSYPRQIGKTPLLPSPYLAHLAIPIMEARDDGAIASWQELRQRGLRHRPPPPLNDPVLAHAARSWSIEWRRHSSPGGDRFQGLTEIPLDIETRQFSASQLTHLGQCGFKWFAGDLLKIRELAEADTELSGRLQGKLYHKTLELATQKALDSGSSDLRQALLEHLEAAFLEAEALEQLPDLAAWGVRRKEHLQRLRRTLSQDSFLADDRQILGTEQFFEGEWYGFRVRGQVDRLDRTPEGYAIIEYKSRSNRPTRAKSDQGKAELDIQLPLYRDVVGGQVREAEAGGDHSSVQAYYYSLTKARPLGLRDNGDRQALEQFSDRLKTHLRQGHYPVDPDRQQQVCRYCPHDAICRKR